MRLHPLFKSKLLAALVAASIASTAAGGSSSRAKFYYDAAGIHDLARTGTPAITHGVDARDLFARPVGTELHTYVEPFVMSDWARSGTTVLHLLTGENYPMFLAWAAGGNAALVPSIASLTSNGWEKFRTFLRSWGAAHMHACHSDRCMRMLLEAFDRGGLSALTPAALKALTGLQMAQLIRHAMDPARSRSLVYLRGLPAEVLNRLAPVIVIEMGDRFPELVSVDTARKILQGGAHPNACACLSQGAIERMINSPMAKLITDACLITRERVGMPFGSVRLAPRSSLQLDGKALSGYNGSLDASVYPQLRSHHIQNYASQVSPLDQPGKGLNFAAIPEALIPKISQKLFLGKLHSLPSPTILLGARAKKLPSEIFDNLSDIEVYTSLSRLSADDWVSLPPKALQTIADKHPVGCAFLRPETVKDLAITGHACFLNMHPRTQAATLMDAKRVGDDFFPHLSLDAVRNWYYAIKDQTFQGFHILGAKSSTKAPLGKLIPQLGEDPNGESPCRGLNSLFQVLEIKPLREHITVPCLQEAELELPESPEELKELPERMRYMEPFEKLRQRHAGQNFFEKLTPKRLSYLASGRDFCANVDVPTIKLIPAEAFTAVDAQCWRDMSEEIRDSLSPAQLSKVPKEVTSGLIDGLSSQDLDRMESDVLAQILAKSTAEGADDPKNLGRLLTRARLESLDDLSIIKAGQWSACNLATLGGIDGKRLSTIPPERLIYWRDDMAGAVSADVMATLNEQQAAKIGLNVDLEKQPVKRLLGLERLGTSSRQVLLGRQETGPRPWVWIVIWTSAGLLVAIPLAGYGFYLWRQSSQRS